MNEENDAASNPPPETSPVEFPPLEAPPNNPLAHWIKKFFACNPFYLLSAALLLYGFHCVSADSGFLKIEQSQLLFNLSSLEVYEMLLVVTAIFLARRKIWYDSTLLVALENLFVFVPFILITQGALINQHYVWTLCLIGAALVVVRFGAMRRFIAGLNFPKRLCEPGLLLLALNVALPIIYRSLHESNRNGSDPDFGAQFEMSKYTWLLILPAAFALGNILPNAKEVGLLPLQRRWLPSGFFALWLTATVVHVYCLDYMYSLHIPTEWIAPGLWVLAWTACRIIPGLFSLPKRPVQIILAGAAILVPLMAASEEWRVVYLTLAGLNAAIFCGLSFMQEHRRVARHLLFLCGFMFAAGLPDEWMRRFMFDSTREQFIGLGGVGYFLCWAVLSRNPRLGLLGGGMVFCAILALCRRDPDVLHLAMQGGLTWVLLHSLLWDDTQEHRAARIITAGAWVIHSFLWMRYGGLPWAPCVPAGLVLGGYLAGRLFRGQWDYGIVAIAAVLVALSGPSNALYRSMQLMPSSVLILLGSFFCFGLGTVAALTKHRWHHDVRN